MNEAATQDPIYAFKRLILIVCALLELMFSPDYDGTVPPALQRMIDEFLASLRTNMAAPSITTTITAPSRLRCDASAPLQASRRTTASPAYPTETHPHPTTTTRSTRPDPPPNRSKTRQIPTSKHAYFVTISQ